jgi:ketosteroid isomerase-like protein
VAIVRPDGDRTRGRAEIAAALKALLDNGVTVKIEVASIFAAGDVAVATGTFNVNGTGADGQPFDSRSSSVVVYTRADDGWRIALDAPWGLPQA